MIERQLDRMISRGRRENATWLRFDPTVAMSKMARNGPGQGMGTCCMADCRSGIVNTLNSHRGDLKAQEKARVDRRLRSKLDDDREVRVRS